MTLTTLSTSDAVTDNSRNLKRQEANLPFNKSNGAQSSDSMRDSGKSTTDSGSEVEDLCNLVKTRNPVVKEQPQGQVRAGLRSLTTDKPVRVKFVNHSGKEVQMYWINYIGECEKAFKISDGRNEIIDTYESHPWIAANARNKKVHHAFMINSNLVYYPGTNAEGGKYTVAEIRRAPEKLADLQSKSSGKNVTVKYINRTSRPAYIEVVNLESARELQYEIPPNESWETTTQEQTFWIATGNKETDEGLLLNYGWYYSPIKTRNKKERVYITDYI